MLFAVRKNDLHLCPAHGIGPVTGSTDGHVETNGRPQARVGDTAHCRGPDDIIVTGSGTVTIKSKPAARLTDRTMHLGQLFIGSPNVIIGGPTVGSTLGNPAAGKKACEAAAAGRASGRTKQTYYNCGVESVRQIINKARGTSVTEDDLLGYAVDRGLADGSFWHPKDLTHAGGTDPDSREQLLNDNGVPAEQVPGTMTNLIQAASEGKGVCVAIWAGGIWPEWAGYAPGTGPHAILVTGIEFDEAGNVKSIIVNDTGIGDCGKSYPPAVIEKALRGANHVVTKSPIW